MYSSLSFRIRILGNRLNSLRMSQTAVLAVLKVVKPPSWPTFTSSNRISQTLLTLIWSNQRLVISRSSSSREWVQRTSNRIKCRQRCPGSWPKTARWLQRSSRSRPPLRITPWTLSSASRELSSSTRGTHPTYLTLRTSRPPWLPVGAARLLLLTPSAEAATAHPSRRAPGPPLSCSSTTTMAVCIKTRSFPSSAVAASHLSRQRPLTASLATFCTSRQAYRRTTV